MMFRRLAVAGIAAGLLALAYADVSACGDKFMRPGRSVSSRRYAALHPSAILIYRPARSTSPGMAMFEDMLKKAGHSARVLQRGEDVAPILATAKYPLVIAEYSDLEMLKKEVDAAPSRPAILPILLDSNKPAEAQLRKDFHCLLNPRAMSDNDALVEIDHALDFRLKDGGRLAH
jgi:hypothetical protein